MAYDSARGVTVLFGGGTDSDSPSLRDTWEWDGTRWKERASTGPSNRRWHAMVYDSARGVTVLFGGWEYYQYYSDTFEWDGQAWHLRASPDRPARRAFHAMAYDSQRERTVLFGGSDPYGLFGETWEWDGRGYAAWTNYGSGWPGTLGVPSFVASDDPVLCNPIDLDLANSRGLTTFAGLFLGSASTDLTTAYDGHLLVLPQRVLLLALPAAGVTLGGTLPCDGALCGRSIILQSLELDPGASQGISFTRGLHLVLGTR
jgi:hypothetical protein